MGDSRKSSNHGFVQDGCSRARLAIEPQVRRQVIAEYGEQLAAAGFWGRLWLRLVMNREVERRIHLLAPPDALY